MRARVYCYPALWLRFKLLAAALQLIVVGSAELEADCAEVVVMVVDSVEAEVEVVVSACTEFCES